MRGLLQLAEAFAFGLSKFGRNRALCRTLQSMPRSRSMRQCFRVLIGLMSVFAICGAGGCGGLSVSGEVGGWKVKLKIPAVSAPSDTLTKYAVKQGTDLLEG